MQNLTRRELLRLGTAAAVVELASLGLHGCGISKLVPSVASGCFKITDIEHVVILTQENRSFDHYFGSYRGVRGFSDQSAAFQQPDPANTTISPVGTLLPFHLDTSRANAACTPDITHDWVPQHQSWDNGKMDGFVSSRLPINSNDAVLSMGYYTRADLPYCRVGGGALARWPPSAAQTARTLFAYAAFTKTQSFRDANEGINPIKLTSPCSRYSVFLGSLFQPPFLQRLYRCDPIRRTIQPSSRWKSVRTWARL